MLAIIIFVTVAIPLLTRALLKNKNQPTKNTPHNWPFCRHAAVLQVARETGFLNTAQCCLPSKVQFLNQHNRGSVRLSSWRRGLCPAVCAWLDCCVVGVRERSLCWRLSDCPHVGLKFSWFAEWIQENRLLLVLWKCRFTLLIP